MSCGQLALQRAGFEVDRYMASEIDKYGMQVTRKNFPNTIQMGDVCALRGENLPPIDLLMGGSPCQGFSFAGKQLNFEDPRSALFFQFVRLLRETKPKYFLLENVRMKQEYQDVISEHLGVKPVMICSSLVSAQSRKRLYWTNIPGLIQPEDKGIVLKDILEDGVSDRPCEPKKFKQDSTCHHAATATDIKGNDSIKRVYADSGKSPTLTTCGGGHREPKVLCGAWRGRSFDKDGNPTDWKSGEHKQVLETREDGKTNSLTSVQKDNVLIVKEATKKGCTELQDDCLTAANYDYMVLDGPYPMQFKAKNKKNVIINESDLDAPRTVYEARTELGKQTRREIKKLTGKDSTKRSPEHKQYQVQKHQKANCLVTVDSELNKVIDKKLVYRKLTPVECMRLQTVDDDYFDDTGISNTQRYKLLGNGWTVDVICHLLKGIKAEFARKVA